VRMTVFGAAGSVGQRVVAEAWRRGHEVTGVTRSRRVGFEVGDAASVDDVVRLSAGRDAVVAATRPAPGREHELVTATKALLAGVRETGVRLLVVGGAASLRTPEGPLVQDAPDFPAELRAIALACSEQLEICRAETEADWVYLSPPALLIPGERTGGYRTAMDDLVVDPDGRSAISVEDLAVALLDEAGQPRHRRTRFTVGY
jgi:uncharacterized protein